MGSIAIAGSGGGGRTLLTANTNYYVATTGSDSNPGTLAQPWATTQHAMNFIAGNIDTAGFNVTVNLLAGSFAGLGLKDIVGGGNVPFIGAGVGSTTLTAGPNDGRFNGGECVSVYENATSGTFYFSGMKMDSTGVYACIGQYVGSFITIGNIGAGPVLGCDFVIDNSQNGALAYVQGGASTLKFQNVTSTITFSPANGAATLGIQAEDGATIETNIWNFTIAGNPTFSSSGFLSAITSGITDCQFIAPTVTGVIGTWANGSFGGVVLDTGIPAGLSIIFDPSSIYNGFFGIASGAGLPTTTQFPYPRTGGLYKDTSGGGVYSVFNDGGTIKKVQLT